MFSQTLAHENSNNEIRQRHRGRRYEERSEYGNNYSWHEIKSADGLTIALAYRARAIGDRYSIERAIGLQSYRGSLPGIVTPRSSG